MKNFFKDIIRQLDIIGQCGKYNVPLRQCPQFLFLIMGIITVAAMLAVYFIGLYYNGDPEKIALVVIALATAMMVLSFIIVHSFEQLAETSRLKTEFISIVSHQIRSPLTNLKWIVEILTSGILGKTENKQSEYFKILKENLERMQKLVSELLTVSRIEATKLILKKENFSMENLARDLVSEFAPISKSSHVEIKVITEGKVPKVCGDPFQVLQVVENLVYNAIRYIGFATDNADNAANAKHGEVEIRLYGKGKYVYCQVKDNGIGIPKEDQKYIFQKFFRAENVRRYQTSGSGLGLYIAKNIVERSGGKIGFLSREGEGTTFWFRLPAASNHKDKTANKIQKINPKFNDKQNQNIKS